MMNLEEIEQMAKRRQELTKAMLAELLGRSDDFGEGSLVSRFVDSVVSTAMLEMSVAQLRAIDRTVPPRS